MLLMHGFLSKQRHPWLFQTQLCSQLAKGHIFCDCDPSEHHMGCPLWCCNSLTLVSWPFLCRLGLVSISTTFGLGLQKQQSWWDFKNPGRWTWCSDSIITSNYTNAKNKTNLFKIGQHNVLHRLPQAALILILMTPKLTRVGLGLVLESQHDGSCSWPGITSGPHLLTG